MEGRNLHDRYGKMYIVVDMVSDNGYPVYDTALHGLTICGLYEGHLFHSEHDDYTEFVL